MPQSTQPNPSTGQALVGPTVHTAIAQPVYRSATIVAPQTPFAPQLFPSGPTQYQQALTVASPTTASIGKAATHALTASTVSAPSVSKLLPRALTTSGASAATLLKQLGKPLSASSASVPALQRAASKLVTASSATSASIKKAASKSLTASSASAVTLGRVLPRVLAASSVTAATIARQAAKTLSASSASALSVSKRVSKTISLASASATTLQPLKVTLVVLSAASSSTAAIVRAAAKTLSASSPSAAAIGKRVAKTLSAASTTASSLVKQLRKSLTAQTTSAATMTPKLIYGRVLLAASATTSSIARAATKLVSAVSASQTAITRQLPKTLATSALSVSTLARTSLRQLSASSAAIASFGPKAIAKTASASTATLATLSKRLSRTLSVASPLVPVLVVQAGQRLQQALSAVSHVMASIVALLFPSKIPPPPILSDAPIATLVLTDAPIVSVTLTDSKSTPALDALLLALNPIAYLPLSALPAIDLSGNAHNGATVGTPTPVAPIMPGDVDGALSVVSGRVTIPDSPAFAFGGSGSFSVLLFGTTSDQTGPSKWLLPFWKGGSSAVTVGYDMETTSGPGNKNFVPHVADGTTIVSAPVNSYPVNDGKLHLLVMVVDRIAQTLTAYVDGTGHSFSASIAAVGSVNNANAIQLSQSGDPWNGVLAKFAIFGYALSQQQIKDIWNAATSPNAGSVTLADALTSPNGNLVKNDHGQFGNNTNWSGAAYDPLTTFRTDPSFKVSTFSVSLLSDALVPIDISQRYFVAYWAESSTHVVGAHAYLGVAPYDIDGLPIQPYHVMWRAGTLTTLAADLHPGDTTIQLTSAANWFVGATSFQRSIIIWNYVDAHGTAWGSQTYSRNILGQTGTTGAYAQNGITGNTINLVAPWAGSVIIPAGTPISNGNSGGTYMYCCANNVDIPAAWTRYSGIIAAGYDTTGTAPTNQWWPGVAQVKMLLLLNRDVTGNVTNFTDVVLQELDTSQSLTLADAPVATVTLTDAPNG